MTRAKHLGIVFHHTTLAENRILCQSYRRAFVIPLFAAGSLLDSWVLIFRIEIIFEFLFEEIIAFRSQIFEKGGAGFFRFMFRNLEQTNG